MAANVAALLRANRPPTDAAAERQHHNDKLLLEVRRSHLDLANLILGRLGRFLGGARRPAAAATHVAEAARPSLGLASAMGRPSSSNGGEDGSVVTVSATTIRVLYCTRTTSPQRSVSRCASQKREGAQDHMQGPRTEWWQRGKTPRIKQQQAQLSQTQ
jgi:hypothetical protein